jgi:transposase-like protein
MPPVDRNNPVRGAGSESSYSVLEFMREFPDDASCLDYLWRERFSENGRTAFCERCNQERTHARYPGRPSYDCTACGKHISVTAGTVFHKSSTSLQLWFYAMYLMASTRCGISAKQLERELGVTYKTAWRMFKLIRTELMSQDDEAPLEGSVEMDETFVGGKPKESERRRLRKLGVVPQTAAWDRHAVVFGAVERGGRIRASVVPNSRASTILPLAREYVLPASLIYTDEYHGYKRLGQEGYTHKRINHSAKVYVEGDTHTQTIDGFFGLFKNAVRGVHHGVSHKWLQGYLNEYVWRYNRRGWENTMFRDLLDEAASRTV